MQPGPLVTQPLHWIILAVLLGTSGAWASGEDPASDSNAEVELIEKVLVSTKKVEVGGKFSITVGQGQVYEFETTPNSADMRAALGMNLPEKMKQEILARGGSIEEADPMRSFNSLSSNEKLHFQENRVAFLTGFARFLNATKFAYGTGSIVGDSFRFIKVKTKKLFGQETETGPTEHRSFQLRSQQAVQGILRAVDYKLFYQAPLVIGSPEYGLSMSVGIAALNGVLNKGGGGSEEMGLSFSYNKASRAFVFEIFHNSENFDNTKAAVGVLGVFGKLGMTVSRRQSMDPLKGSSFYPPAFPGYTSVSPEYFAFGGSSNLGLPLPPLADLMTYTNKFQLTPLIRVTISPVVKGYVRLEFGSFRNSGRLVVMRFVDMYHAIATKTASLMAGSCARVFAAAP